MIRNGGSNPNPTSLTVTYGGTYGKLPVVTKTGYSFEGWYTSTVGGDSIEENTQVRPSNLTLYARWESLINPLECTGIESNGRNSFVLTFNNNLLSIRSTDLNGIIRTYVSINGTQVTYNYDSIFGYDTSTGTYHITVRDEFNQTLTVNLELKRRGESNNYHWIITSQVRY